MRLTHAVWQVNYHRHFQRIWKRQGKMEVKDFRLSPELQELNIDVKNAKDILLETKLFKHPVMKKKGLPYPLPPTVFSSKAPFYLMHAGVKATENENQALALTKTVLYKGLPSSITSLIGADSLPNQNELVQRSILQAQVWDATQEKLPKIFNPDRPSYVYKRPYGISQGKKVLSLLEKLSFLCDSVTGRYAGCFQRNKILDACSEISVKRNGSNVVFQMPCDILLESSKPLQRFASPEAVQATTQEALPDIYPIKPTLDLDKCDSNPLGNSAVRFPRPSPTSIHTLFVTETSCDSWLPSQQLVKAIATCFSFAAVEAREKYGEDVKDLPEPISLQCMYMDAKAANFIAYQLNTLHLEDNEGIKNQVWTDEAADFYSSVSETNLIIDYNPSLFPKMLAFHINGLHS